MAQKSWFANDFGHCEVWEANSPTDLAHPKPDRPSDRASELPYRLYRFLTDLEDILASTEDDRLRLQAICPLVRRLLNSSTWLQMTPLVPDPQTGWEVLMLYDEPFFPLTVQLVAWSPGVISPIHNHATWGVVALLQGQEKNTFWQRNPTEQLPDRIEAVCDRKLSDGDILCLMPESIHQIEALGDRPTISFNVYGETDYSQRFEFDPKSHTAQIF
jgi:predicted metal-dependent enzyme (double-stranded beta helix superfamily)